MLACHVIAIVTAIGWLKRIFLFKIVIVWQQWIIVEKRKENYLKSHAVFLFFQGFIFSRVSYLTFFFSSFVVRADTPCKM
jgi:hypothetical protein